jgi:hypothetical protein
MTGKRRPGPRSRYAGKSPGASGTRRMQEFQQSEARVADLYRLGSSLKALRDLGLVRAENHLRGILRRHDVPLRPEDQKPDPRRVRRAQPVRKDSRRPESS